MTNRTDTNLAGRLFVSQALLKERLQRARYDAANPATSHRNLLAHVGQAGALKRPQEKGIVYGRKRGQDDL